MLTEHVRGIRLRLAAYFLKSQFGDAWTAACIDCDVETNSKKETQSYSGKCV